MQPVLSSKYINLAIPFFCSVFVLLIFLSFQRKPPLIAAELLTNAGFEDGTAGWTPSPGTTIFRVVNSPVYSGSWAASVGSASGSTKAVVQNVGGIVAGNRYQLSGYGYKNDPNVARVRLRLAWYATADCSGSQSIAVDSNELMADTPTFLFLTTGLVSAPDNAQCAQVRAQVQPVGRDAATAYFDALAITAANNPPPPLPITSTNGIVINEIAWGGTVASASDEWLELHNVTTQTINLAGWVLTGSGGLFIDLAGDVAPGDYFLLERTDDETVSDIEAGQLYSGNLSNNGETLYLSVDGVVVDTANLAGGPWPGGSGSPEYATMERIAPLVPDTDDNWTGNNLRQRNGHDAAGNLINGTPGQPNSTVYPPPPVVPLLISELLYDGLVPSTEADEFVEICNPTPETADLTGYKIGDEETKGAGEGMYRFPSGELLPAATCLVIAKNAAQFATRFSYFPNFEVITAGEGYTDTPAIPNLEKYASWGSGAWALANHSDEFLVLGPDDQLLDAVAYREGAYETLGLLPAASAPEPFSMQRIWPRDNDWMGVDFFRDNPTPGSLTPLPALLNPPDPPPAAASLPGGMRAYMGSFFSESTFAAGSAPPSYLFARARANGWHFLGVTDPGEALTDFAWDATLTEAISGTIPGEFVALRGVTWRHDEDGSITLFNSAEPVYPGHPQLETLADLYAYLVAHPEIIAQFNTTPSRYDPEIASHFFGQVWGEPDGENRLDLITLQQSWSQGWQVAPILNSNLQAPGWGTEIRARTGVVAPALTESDLLAAIRSRRIFATTDTNLVVVLRTENIWMGSELPEPGPLDLQIFAGDPNAESTTLTLFDRTVPLTAATATTPYTWTVPILSRAGHFYWVQAIQADGDLAVSAPLWVAGEAAPETILLSEFLPNPGDTDWNGDGAGNSEDEWIEVFNPNEIPINLAGWTFSDETEQVYTFPADTLVPAGDYYLLQRAISGIALNNSGDLLVLYRPDGSVADTISFHDDPGPDITICRRQDTGAWWTRCLPSPNAPNIYLPPDSPLELSIYEAKRVTEGAWVKVRGYVTVPAGRFGRNVMYIQDETHGIRVKLPGKHGLRFELGDRVEVIGYLDLFMNEWELDVKGNSEINRLDGHRIIDPLPINSGLLSEGYEGLLVQLEVMPVAFERRKRHFWGDDGSGPAYIYIYSASGIKRRGLTLDVPLTIVGIVNQRAGGHAATGGYRLSPRYQFDIIQHSPLPSTAADDWPNLLPATGDWSCTGRK